MRSRGRVWLALVSAAGLVAIAVAYVGRDDPGTQRSAGVEPASGEYPVPPPGRIGPGFAIADGRVVVFGGRHSGAFDDFVASTSQLDLSTGSWEQLPEVPWPPSAHAIAAVGVGTSVVALAAACQSEPDRDTPADVDPIYECPMRMVGARLDLTEHSWLNLALPAGISDSGGTPDLLGSYGTDAFFAVGEPDHRLIWRYGGASDEWERVRTPFRAWDSCVMGDMLAIVGADYLRNGKVSEKTSLDGGLGEAMSASPGDGWTSPRIATLPLSSAPTRWSIGPGVPQVLYPDAPPELRCGANAVMVAPQLQPADWEETKSFVFWPDRNVWSNELEAMLPQGQILSPMNGAVEDQLILLSLVDADPACVLFDLRTAKPVGFDCPSSVHGDVEAIASLGSKVATLISGPGDEADTVEIADV